MTDRLTVLLTNIWLTGRAGSEMVTRDLAFGLLRRGHRPIVYSPLLGDPAEEIARRGVVVIDDLRKLAEPPDILHAHHVIPCGEALFRFPDIPAIQTCHAFVHWAEAPAHFPQVAAYVAVDEACRDRLVQSEGIDPNRVVLIPNAVDLARIPPRPKPLAPRPQRAVAFGKAAHAPEMRLACEQLGLAFEEVGTAERPLAEPERELVKADLVFASARCALESLCCGCAVIVCDVRGLAGLVTSRNFADLRAKNFGLRSLGEPLTVESCVREIKRYDAEDAARVAASARHEADLERQLDQFESLYHDVLSGARRPQVTREARDRAMAQFLHDHLPRYAGDVRYPWLGQRDDLLGHVQALERQLGEMRARAIGMEQELNNSRDVFEAELTNTRRERDKVRHGLAAAHLRLAQASDELAETSKELAVMRRSRLLKAGRLVRRVLGLPVRG